MSGTQESAGIRLPTWRRSDFNAAIPIKKRKHFLQPQLPAVEEAASALLQMNPQPSEQVAGTSVGRSGLDSSDADKKQKTVGGSKTNVGEPVTTLPSVSVGNADKAESIGNQIRVKVEPSFLVHSSPLTGFEIPSSSNILASSLSCSLGKLPVGAEHPGLDKIGMKVEQSIRKTDDIVRETCGKENLRGERDTGASSGAGTENSSLYGGKEEPTVLNRSNWDLNTVMDDWADGLDRRTRVKTNGHDIETSSCRDATAVAKSVSEKQKESVGFKSHAVTLMQFDHHVNPSPTCSLSLGLGSYPPVEKYSSLSGSTSGALAACTSSSRPIAGNLNSVTLRTVKSEVIEESSRLETKNAQVCSMGLSINRVKQEVVGRINQGNSPPSNILKFVKPVSIKAEPNSFSQAEVLNRKDGTLNHFHTPVMQSDAILDLPTSSTPNKKDKCLPLSSAIRDAPIALNGMSMNPDSPANENSGQSNSVANGKLCSGHGDHNLNTSGVHVTSLTEEKILDDSKTGISKERPHNYRGSDEEKTVLSGEELQLQRVISDGLSENEGRILEDGELTIHHQIIPASEGMSGVSTVSGGNVENPENVNNSSPVSFKEEISTREFSEGSQRRIINLIQVSNKSPIKTLDASGSFVPLQIKREILPDFPVESQRYHSRGSDDESCKFSRERYHGKVMRSPRLNFMPDRRRFSDQTESNLRDTKNYEFDNHGYTRRGGGFVSNFRRGRRPENDEGAPFSHSFQSRTSNFSYTHRGPRNKEDTSAFSGFRDGEKSPRESQCNNTEPMYMSPQRPYRGRNSGFGRGLTNFSENPKRSFPGFRSRSPVRSRERSTGPSSSFRNRSQEEFGGQTDFSHRRSTSGYRTERASSPDHTGYQRERRHNSPPYSHRPSNSGRGRGYVRGRAYGRGRAYSWKPYDRVVHRNHENMNNLNPRERVNYSDDYFGGPIHSERFGVDVDVERRRFGYRNDGTNSFRPSFYRDGCAPTNVENEHDAVRSGQDPRIEFDEQGSDMEIDGEEDENSAENASGGTKNMDDEETSKQSKTWQQDELGCEGF